MRRWSTFLVLRRELRQRAAAFVGLALVVALGGGASIGSLAAAHRTDRAYPDYVHDSSVVELVVNPSLSTKVMETAIRHSPGATSVHSDSLFLASLTQTRAASVAALSTGFEPHLQVRGSTDGRYEAVDRPVVTDGRFASGDHEVFVTDDYRADLEAAIGRHLHVGDTLRMAFWWALLDSGEVPPNEVVKPIGVESLRIAGFGRLPDEILPDELYKRQRLIVSGDVAARYSCLADVHADMNKQQAEAALFPRTCARQYKYYALQLRDERRWKASVKRAFNVASKRLAGDIPPSVTDIGGSYFYVSQERSGVDHAVRQVTRPTVAALIVFGLVAGLATLTVVALGISRILRRNAAEQRSLRAIGVTRRHRAALGASPALVAALVGMIAAVPVALVVSMMGPLGSVRTVISSPSFALPIGVVGPAVIALGAALVASTTALAWFAAKRASATVEPRQRRSRVAALVARSGRPAATEGIRSALSTRRSDGGAVVVGGCIVALAALSAAVVFGANLNALVREPARYGWPWDVAVISGAGYSDTDSGQVEASLRGNPAIEGYGLFTFESPSAIAGKPVPAIYGFPGAERLTFSLVKGRNASRAGEAVLGASTAKDLHVSIGDSVPIESDVPGLPHRVNVVGIAVLPSLGPFLADRTGLGTGAYVLTDVDPADPHNQNPAALTAIRLRPGTDAKSFLAGLEPKVRRWDANGAPLDTHISPVRPPEIVNADSTRTAPLALAGLLGLGLVIGLALSIAVSVRDRRRELAILRALGFSRRDLRVTVASQAIATIAVGLVVGVPLGVVAGRLAWKTFADQLGVVPRADIPFTGLAAVCAVAIMLALLAAAPPARSAARIAPSEVLHEAP